MDSNILCTLLAQRLNPKYHRVAGENVVWLDEQGQPDEHSFYDTPENRAIVEDVKANYEALAAAWIASEAVKVKTAGNFIAIKSINTAILERKIRRM